MQRWKVNIQIREIGINVIKTKSKRVENDARYITKPDAFWLYDYGAQESVTFKLAFNILLSTM